MEKTILDACFAYKYRFVFKCLNVFKIIQKKNPIRNAYEKNAYNNGNTLSCTSIVHNAISSFVSNYVGFSAQLSYIRVKTKTDDYRTGRSQNQIKSHGISCALMLYFF